MTTEEQIKQLLSDAVSEIVAPLVARIAELEQINQVKILQNAGLIK